MVEPLGRQERCAPHHGIRSRRHVGADRLLRAARRRVRRQVQSPTTGWSRRSSARSTTSSSIAVAAADQALADSGYKAETQEQQERTGVLIGSGIGGLSGIADTSILLKEKGPRRVSPFFIPGRLINLASGHVSIKHQLKGPNHAVVTACSTGSHAIGDAARLIALGDADVMVAGGAESPICRIAVAGFAACRALSTGFNDDPTRASRPYDKDRDGFVMGEGAGIVVLEDYEHAKARGAKIYAEVIGYGLSGDAYHITAPEETGDGAFRCMKAALKRAEIDVSDIDYVNAHGTSTPMGDEIELGAVERLFGNAAAKIAMSSTKSADRPPVGCSRRGRGHLLDPRHSRQRRPADAEPGQSVGQHRDRPRPAHGQENEDRYRSVELVWLRRHQCVADPAPGGLITTPESPGGLRSFAIIFGSLMKRRIS